ncbi:MAG: hypothetical protein H0W50_08560 [Parachlamydiaceae bacterium]|nr:hypothetical protein [Parachlamydiaceae bacterium]
MFIETGLTILIQQYLSQSQAIPVIGPLLVSPLKAVISAVQFVAGSALALISATFGSFFRSPSTMKFAATSGLHAGLGLLSLCYSLANIVSLGILGFYLEHTIKSTLPYI